MRGVGDPEYLAHGRHRRRRQGRQTRGAFRPARLGARCARQSLVDAPRAGWLALRHARFQQRKHAARARRQRAAHPERQYVARAARRFARRGAHVRTGESVWPVLGRSRESFQRRLPQLADLPAPARRVLPELWQTARRPRLRAADGHALARQHGDLRADVCQRSGVAGGMAEPHVRRQRADQPHQPRRDHLARLVVEGKGDAGFSQHGRSVVPTGRSELGAGRRALRGGFLQQDHRPLRSPAHASRPRPRARAALAHRSAGRGKKSRAACGHGGPRARTRQRQPHAPHTRAE